MDTETIKVRVEIENKEEITNWVNELNERLEKANSLANELASKNEIAISIQIDGKEFAKAVVQPPGRFIPLKDKPAEAFKR